MRLFGWDIHAPGLLSENFSRDITPLPERVALYFSPDLLTFESSDRGSRSADPQTFHVGEALAPMLVEGLQNVFEQFVFLETEPTSEILKRYAISYLVLVRIKNFRNRVTMKGQTLALTTEVSLRDPDLKEVGRFEARGESQAEQVFKKKGGPEVNLNAALERNVLATIQSLEDSIRNRSLKEEAKAA